MKWNMKILKSNLPLVLSFLFAFLGLLGLFSQLPLVFLGLAAPFPLVLGGGLVRRVRV